MIRHETTVRLNRPVEHVFAFVADSKQLPMWQSNLIKSEVLTEGPLRVGSRFQEVRLVRQKETEIQGEMTAFEPNRRFTTKTLSKPEVTVSYSFEPENGGTRLRYEFGMVTRGLMRLLQPMILGSIKKDTASDFEKLKQLLEG